MKPTEQPADVPPHRTIVQLEVDSFQRMRAARVTPAQTGLVQVRGKNAAGKSSLIGAMLDALGAEKSELPVTAGEHGANVAMHLKDHSGKGLDLVVRKRWKRGADGKAVASLTIETAGGGHLSTPATVLKELRGRFADPVAFLEMAPGDQVKTVLKVLGLDGRLQELEDVARGHYDRRTEVGRDADRLSKTAAELADALARAGAPATKVDGSVQELTAQLLAAKERNAARATAVSDLSRHAMSGQALAGRIEETKQLLGQLERQKAQVAADWIAAGNQRKALGAVEDVGPILAALNSHEAATSHRSKVEAAERAKVAAADVRKLHERAESDLAAARAAIGELLGSVQFPIAGMAYDHEGKVLTIGGIPFSQASQAEKLKAAAAIAMAGSPSIKVLFARDGSLLDDDSRAQLAEIAAASGFQLWLEVVDSKPEGAGIWVEDGEAFYDVADDEAAAGAAT